MNAINFDHFYNVFSHRKASQQRDGSASPAGPSSPAPSRRNTNNNDGSSSPNPFRLTAQNSSSVPSSPISFKKQHIQHTLVSSSSGNNISLSGSLSSFLPAPAPCTTTDSNGGIFQTLTYDSILDILSFLTVQDLGRLAQVSREARMFAEDDVVWRTLCKALEPRWCEVLHRPANMVPRVYARPSEWKRVYHVELQRIALCAKFVGQWSEKWCDVNVQHSTLIESDGRGWCVTYKKNKFVAQFRDYDPVADVLTFNLEGGDSGWSFVYKIKPITEHHCQLTVFRVHDQKSFAGDFFRSTPNNQTGPQMDNAMGTHL